MYRLYSRYYAGGSHSRFMQDLSQKDYCILLQDERQAVRGFTTLAISEHVISNQRLRCLFSGDTVIQHQFWGEQTLPRAWCRFAGHLKAQEPQLPLYWLLIVKGHRTYRYLKVFPGVIFRRSTARPRNRSGASWTAWHRNALDSAMMRQQA